jgi:hypothetical protein
MICPHHIDQPVEIIFPIRGYQRSHSLPAELTDDKLRDDFRAYHAPGGGRLDIVKKMMDLRQAAPDPIENGRVSISAGA